MPNFDGSHEEDVAAPREQVWAIAADVENAPEWHGVMTEVEVIERDAENRPRRIRTKADASVKTVNLELEFSYDEPQGMSWERVGGDLKAFSGSWSFEEAGPERTHVTHRTEIDPGRMLSALVRGPVESRVRDILVAGPARGLKGRAERG